MNKVYEDFITELLEEIIQEDPEFKGFALEKQKSFASLVKEKDGIITRPDIILRKKDTEEHILLIDAKYKRQESNADYYQIIAYALAIPTTKVCCLVYPAEEDVESRFLTIEAGKFGGNRGDVLLRTEKVDLQLDENLDFLSYIGMMKNQLKSVLHRSLQAAI